MKVDPFHVDKALARHAFERAAPHYDEVAVLQREVGQRLLDRLELLRITPRTVLDLGAGTGLATAALAKRYRKARVVALDLSTAMLRETRKRGGWFRKPACVCGDMERLPLADDSVDLIFSNLTIQWCNTPDRVFAEFARVLAPGGTVLFSSLGPDTLRELREGWARVDSYTHVNSFIDMHDLGDALVRARLAEPVMDVERLTLTYPDVFRLMKDLKQLGAHNITEGRRRGLTGKGQLRALAEAYEAYRREGVLPASYEVVYGHAWAPQVGVAQARTENGVATVPVEQLRRRPPG